MSKQPSSVRIGPYDVPIKTLDPSAAEKQFGEFSREFMTIKLQEEFGSEQQAADAMLHEILHAIWCVSALKRKDGEERIVSVMATQLCALIRDNPGLIKWMQGALK